MRLLAEFEKQKCILLILPHNFSDWANNLDATLSEYLAFVKAILEFEDVILIVHSAASSEILHTLDEIKHSSKYKLQLVSFDTNDTWARDIGIISLGDGKSLIGNDFIFNGWGQKFASNKDNQLNSALLCIYAQLGYEIKPRHFVLEGGSIDTDGRGAIITTANCLFEPNRNKGLSENKILKDLQNYLNAKDIFVFKSGYLRGDDTDSHIDNLVRFIDENTLMYVGLPSSDDEHYLEFLELKNEVKTYAKAKNLNAIALPFCEAVFDENTKERLPASYANFLIINQAVILPIYGSNTDERAIEIATKAFKNRKVVPLKAREIIKQHGSFHCLSMQLYSNDF